MTSSWLRWLSSLAGPASGRALDEGVQMGPVNNPPQFERVSSLVATRSPTAPWPSPAGGRTDHEGNFFASDDRRWRHRRRPAGRRGAVRTGASRVLYRDVDDAVARANATSFGLGGSVWTDDEERRGGVARRLQCGTAWVNTHANLAVDVPFSGTSASGVGVEQGVAGSRGLLRRAGAVDLPTKAVVMTGGGTGRVDASATPRRLVQEPTPGCRSRGDLPSFARPMTPSEGSRLHRRVGQADRAEGA